ncbi:MAG: hypothetical protein ACKOSQ_05335, partial [Planctomycetaceae bacterium]
MADFDGRLQEAADRNYSSLVRLVTTRPVGGDASFDLIAAGKFAGTLAMNRFIARHAVPAILA